MANCTDCSSKLLGLFVLYLKALSKGAAGEFVASIVMKALGRKYHVIHDLTFYDGEKTVQVDHIIISPFGIFVIETKNYSGTIYGRENSDKFTQYLGNKKYEFYSPIKQNKGHIYSLSKVLGGYKYVSVILFSGLSKLKVESETFVGYIGSINRYVKSYKDVVISDEELKNLQDKIKSIRVKGYKVHKQHVKDIKERMEIFDEKVSQNMCPKCGGDLVFRKGKYGDFMGCSNYPKCKFKKPKI